MLARDHSRATRSSSIHLRWPSGGGKAFCHPDGHQTTQAQHLFLPRVQDPVEQVGSDLGWGSAVDHVSVVIGLAVGREFSTPVCRLEASPNNHEAERAVAAQNF